MKKILKIHQESSSIYIWIILKLFYIYRTFFFFWSWNWGNSVVGNMKGSIWLTYLHLYITTYSYPIISGSVILYINKYIYVRLLILGDEMQHNCDKQLTFGKKKYSLHPINNDSLAIFWIIPLLMVHPKKNCLKMCGLHRFTQKKTHFLNMCE